MQKFCGVGQLGLRVWELILSKDNLRLSMVREQLAWKVLEAMSPAAKSPQRENKEGLQRRMAMAM